MMIQNVVTFFLFLVKLLRILFVIISLLLLLIFRVRKFSFILVLLDLVILFKGMNRLCLLVGVLFRFFLKCNIYCEFYLNFILILKYMNLKNWMIIDHCIIMELID